jgi:hypothetical protein
MQEDKFDMSAADFKSYVSSVATFLWSSFSFLLKVFRTHVLLILGLTIATACLSFVVLKNKEKVWEERMSCVYSDNYPKVFGEMLQRIDFLLHSKAYSEAAVLLGMDAKQVEKINSIEGKTLALGKLEENYSSNKEPFYIYAEVADRTVLPILEQKIIDYLCQNPLSQKSQQRQKKKWESRIDFYQQQLNKLDSLKEVIRLAYLANNNKIDFAQQSNSVVDIYKLSDSLSFFLADVRFYYHNYSTVERLNGFMPFNQIQSQSIIKHVIILSFCALIGIWLLLAIRLVAKRTMKY